MARGRKVTVEHVLTTGALATGGSAVALAIIAAPELAPLLLGMSCATSTCVLGIRRSLLRVDMFDCGYRAGWSDAAHEFSPYPARATSRRVVPLRRSRS